MGDGHWYFTFQVRLLHFEHSVTFVNRAKLFHTLHNTLILLNIGAVGLAWCVVFQIFGHSSPEKHPRISPEEKNYLLLSCNKESNDKIVKNVPWKKILLSRKVHALWITHMCSAWGYYLLAISLPTFLEEVLSLTVINVSKFGKSMSSSKFKILDR